MLSFFGESSQVDFHLDSGSDSVWSPKISQDGHLQSLSFLECVQFKQTFLLISYHVQKKEIRLEFFCFGKHSRQPGRTNYNES